MCFLPLLSKKEACSNMGDFCEICCRASHSLLWKQNVVSEESHLMPFNCSNVLL